MAIAAEKYLAEAEQAAVTYGDGLTNANLADEYRYHLEHGKVGTVLGVHPPSRFGELCLDGQRVTRFDEKPEFKEKWINGGFFFFKRQFFFDYLEKHQDCVLEKAPLARLAMDGELMICKHSGFWACMDTPRDRTYLNNLWNSREAPWMIPVSAVQHVQAH